MTDLDFEGDGLFDDVPKALAASDDGMKRLSDLIRQQILAEDDLERLVKEQERKSKELTRLRADLVPSLMKELGFSTVATDDGMKVEIKKIVQASLPQEDGKKSRALAWLREIEAGDVIKNEVRATFGKGEDELADRAAAALDALGIDVERKTTVHPQTLSALVRQRREEGKAVDAENLTLYEGEISKIIRPKRKRARF